MFKNIKIYLFVLLFTIIIVFVLNNTNNNQHYNYNNFIIENEINIIVIDNVEYISIKELCHSFWFNSKYDIKYDGFNQFSLYSKKTRTIILKQFEFIEIYNDLYFRKDYFINNVNKLIMD